MSKMCNVEKNKAVKAQCFQPPHIEAFNQRSSLKITSHLNVSVIFYVFESGLGFELRL